jgi:hypothetical protein
MLTPPSIPGEFVSPRILRHAPSGYILVTRRAATVLNVKADQAVLAAWGWPSALSDEEILERLLALNLERSKRATI